MALRTALVFLSLTLKVLFFVPAYAEVRCGPDETCTFGVFPHTSTRQLQNTYSPMAEDLSLILDRPVRFVTGESMQHFLEQTRNQKWDIALIGPGQLVLGGRPAGYVPIARPAYEVVYEIVTLPRTGITEPKQLSGKRMGMMPKSTGTHLLSHELLASHGIDTKKDLQITVYPSEHDCVHALLIDRVDACGLATPILNILREQKPAPFLRLTASEPMPSAAYVVHPRMLENDRSEIADYLLSREGLIPASYAEYETYLAGMQRLHSGEK